MGNTYNSVPATSAGNSMVMDCAGGLEKPATPEPKQAPKPAGDSAAPWALAGASPGTPASLRLIQDQEAAAGSQVESWLSSADDQYVPIILSRCMSPVSFSESQCAWNTALLGVTRPEGLRIDMVRRQTQACHLREAGPSAGLPT